MTMKRTSVVVTSGMFLFLSIAVVLSNCGGGGGGGGGGTPAAPVSEGSIASPVNLGTASATLTHSGSVASYDTSFYKFTTGPTGTYTISLTSTKSDLEWSLWSDPGFITIVLDCDTFSGAHDEICSVPLPAGTTYYLAVDEWDHVAGTYTLAISHLTSPPAPFIAAQVITWATTPPTGFPIMVVDVCTDWNCGTPINDAIVTINSTTLSYSVSSQAYEASAMPALGVPVSLSVAIPGGWPVVAGTYTASGTQYTTVPSVTSPAASATWDHTAPNTVTWTAGSPTTASEYLVGIMDDGGDFYPTNVNNGPIPVSTTLTTYTLPASSITATGSYHVFVGLGTQGIVAGTGGISISPSAAAGSGLWIGTISSIVDITVN
jgi:hypothetical protein